VIGCCTVCTREGADYGPLTPPPSPSSNI
jgi:hypothetical protein